jgi:hypothetical protein
MFIPNKTYQAIRTVVVSLIGVLLLVIAGQSVLYIKTANENTATLDSLTTRVDTMVTYTQEDILKILRRQHDMEQRITQMEHKLSTTRVTVDRLLRNECTPETAVYMVTKEMVAMCRTLGTIPE